MIPALGHSFGDWYESIAPTTTSYGQERRDCQVCDAYETRETDKLPAPTVTTYATITADVLRIRSGPGTDYGQVGQYYQGDEVEILEIQTVGDKDWGRTKDGWICLTGYTELKTVENDPHTSHSFGEWYITLEATCTEEGRRNRDCLDCGFQETEAIPPLGHTYADGICVRCQAAEIIPGDVNGDGRKNVSDARILLQYIAGLAEVGQVNEQAADYNADGKVNVRDVRLLLRSIADLG